MRERTLETAPADTATPPTPTMRKRRRTSTSLYPMHPAPRVARKKFWTARIKEIPSFKYNPWDFYKSFLKLGSGPLFVLCNNRINVTMRQLRGFNNLEFRVRNQLLGYRGSIYMRWRPTLQCRRLGRGLGRRLGRGWEEAHARHVPTHDNRNPGYKNF
jgi:hypothetical protein